MKRVWMTAFGLDKNSLPGSSRSGLGLMTTSLILAWTCTLLHADTQLTVNIPPRKGDNFIQASFDLLVPQKIERPRYILVLLPGFNGDGQRFLQDKVWRDFAEETDAAMLACTFIALPEETDEEIENYVHYAAAQHGSGAVLEQAIEQFDQLNSTFSLKDLPLLIYGHSAGGQFAYGFSCHRPKRMIGFVAAKGGYYYPEPVDGTYKVPGLIISGEQDLARRKIEIRSLFESHRKHGAPWCWMEDAYGHGTASTLDVIIPYFRELIRLRLPATGNTLVAISKDEGVIASLETKTILNRKASAPTDNTDPRSAFLPSVSVFKIWLQHDTGKRKYINRTDQPDKN